ncbi:hypothetical protein BC833DRAFT_588624 [Globomyces pollinis-pini]|nr:hypothetical protein BC833DRAFT_588624 [Globomyces pollinis-pini]
MGLLQYLSYSSPKIVVVQDWRLGLLYYTILLLISAYIIYNMITTGSYLDKSPPVAGSVRASVRFNKTARGVPDYCTPGPFNPDGCVYWTPEQIAFPYAGELNTIFLTTRVSTSKIVDSSNCDYSEPNNANCTTPPANYITAIRKTYYVANVEYLTIQVDHSVRAQSSISIGAASYSTFTSDLMVGSLINDCNEVETAVSTFNETYRENNIYNSTLDVMPITDILQASYCGNRDKFDLAIKSKAPGAKTSEDMRSAGLIISMPIAYTNRRSQPGHLKYQYLPAIIDGSEFKVTEMKMNGDGSVTYISRHGIRIVFAQTGTIGIFNPIALILNLVAAFALFSVAQVVVDSLMIYLLPKKHIYYNAKFQETKVEDDDIEKPAHSRSSSAVGPKK